MSQSSPGDEANPSTPPKHGNSNISTPRFVTVSTMQRVHGQNLARAEYVPIQLIGPAPMVGLSNAGNHTGPTVASTSTHTQPSTQQIPIAPKKYVVPVSNFVRQPMSSLQVSGLQATSNRKIIGSQSLVGPRHQNYIPASPRECGISVSQSTPLMKSSGLRIVPKLRIPEVQSNACMETYVVPQVSKFSATSMSMKQPSHQRILLATSGISNSPLTSLVPQTKQLIFPTELQGSAPTSKICYPSQKVEYPANRYIGFLSRPESMNQMPNQSQRYLPAKSTNYDYSIEQMKPLMYSSVQQAIIPRPNPHAGHLSGNFSSSPSTQKLPAQSINNIESWSRPMVEARTVYHASCTATSGSTSEPPLTDPEPNKQLPGVEKSKPLRRPMRSNRCKEVREARKAQESQAETNEIPLPDPCRPAVRVIEITHHGQLVEVVKTGEVFELNGLFYEGYNYGMKNFDRTRFQCIKGGCIGRIIVEKLDMRCIKIVNNHTCDQTTHEMLETKVFRELCVEAAMEAADGTKPSEIYAEVKDKYKELSKEALYSRMYKTISNAFKNSAIRTGVKSKYSSIKAFGEHLMSDPKLLTYSSKKGDVNLKISVELLNSSTESYHLIFYDEELISKFDSKNPIFTDSTFNIRPQIKGVAQFTTIMAKIYNQVIPIAWVLMSRRTSQAYDAVWNFFRRKFPNFKPDRGHSDYEKASIKSMRNSFPGIVVKGCWFHYVQATSRKAKSPDYRLCLRAYNWRDNKNGHEILRKIGYLALLPHYMIEEGLKVIEGLIEKYFSNDTAVYKKWLRYLEYFRSEWMDIVGPKVFSVYNLVDRTNNNLESLHNWYWSKLRTLPPVYKLLWMMIKLNQKSKERVERAKLRIKDTIRENAKSRLDDEIIRDYWLELFSEPAWSVEKFLHELYKIEDNRMYQALDRLYERELECEKAKEEGDEEPNDSDIEIEKDLDEVKFSDSEGESHMVPEMILPTEPVIEKSVVEPQSSKRKTAETDPKIVKKAKVGTKCEKKKDPKQKKKEAQVVNVAKSKSVKAKEKKKKEIQEVIPTCKEASTRKTKRAIKENRDPNFEY